MSQQAGPIQFHSSLVLGQLPQSPGRAWEVSVLRPGLGGSDSEGLRWAKHDSADGSVPHPARTPAGSEDCGSSWLRHPVTLMVFRPRPAGRGWFSWCQVTRWGFWVVAAAAPSCHQQEFNCPDVLNSNVLLLPPVMTKYLDHS